MLFSIDPYQIPSKFISEEFHFLGILTLFRLIRVYVASESELASNWPLPTPSTHVPCPEGRI